MAAAFKIREIPLSENLIRRYAEDDLDFIVIEMERDGKSIQQVYHSFK